MVHLIGGSRPHLEILDKLSRVAGTDAEVLISGPTGVGKELYALYVHEKSKRARFPFVAVNCGAIPMELLENELFGHKNGAYTSAGTSQEGLIAQAENGTLFLDEVDTFSMSSQVKLLRFIQQKEYRRLGDSRIRSANIRFIAATNANLPSLVDQGLFRSDLYYRLRVFPVEVLPLKDRTDDVQLLIDVYATEYSEQYKLPRIIISSGALQAMLDYPWPGNVRELENCVKYLTCLQLARPVDKYDLPMLEKSSPANELFDAELLGKPFTNARAELVAEFEKRYVSEALRKTNGNITRASMECGEYPKKFSRLMKRHGIQTGPAVREEHGGQRARYLKPREIPDLPAPGAPGGQVRAVDDPAPCIQDAALGRRSVQQGVHAHTELTTEFERCCVEAVLRKTDSNISRAAEECDELCQEAVAVDQ